MMLASERETRYTERAKSQDNAVKAALEAAERAVAKEAQNAEKWRDNANEWRAAMQDREVRFLSKDEYSGNHDALTHRVVALEEKSNQAFGKEKAVSQTGAFIFAVVLIAVNLLSVITIVVLHFVNTSSSKPSSMPAAITQIVKKGDL